MAKNVIIKSNGHGISLKLKRDCMFEDIINELRLKLSEAGTFFKDAHIVLEIQGRILTDNEVSMIINSIEENSKMIVLCVVPYEDEIETKFLALTESVQQKYFDLFKKEQFIPESTIEQSKIFEGTLRSGQDFVTTGNAIIIGDVNPGARVMAGENVIVFGSLLGNVSAGNNGNDHAYVLALDMNPGQMCINGIYGRSADEHGFRKKNKLKQEVQIARLFNKGITIENYKDDGGK